MAVVCLMCDSWEFMQLLGLCPGVGLVVAVVL